MTIIKLVLEIISLVKTLLKLFEEQSTAKALEQVQDVHQKIKEAKTDEDRKALVRDLNSILKR